MQASDSCIEHWYYQTSLPNINFFETIRDAANKLCALNIIGICIGHDAVLFLQCQKWLKFCDCHLLLHNCVSRFKFNDKIILGTFGFFGPLRIQHPRQRPCAIQADVATLAMSAATGVLCQGFLFEIVTPCCKVCFAGNMWRFNAKKTCKS